LNSNLPSVLTYLYWILTLANIYISSRIYRKLGSSLSLRSLDPYSYLFFSQLFFCVLGSSFISSDLFQTEILYALGKSSFVYFLGWLTVQYSFVALAYALYLFNSSLANCSTIFIFRTRLSNPIRHRSLNVMLTSLIFIVLLLATIYVVSSNLYHPLIMVFNFSSEALAQIRSETKIGFPGIAFIRDYLFSGLAQIFSLYLFSVLLQKTTPVRCTLFIFSILLAFYATTFNLEKGPFIIYLISLLSMESLHGRVISKARIIALVFALAGLLLFFYLLTLGFDRPFSYFINEILGRIFLAQVSGVYLSLYTFPHYHDFIGFSGLSLFASALSLHPSDGVGRVLMSLYWPLEVKQGLLGYLSSYFPSEAYGNYGFSGLLLSPFIVALSTSLLTFLSLSFRNYHLGSSVFVYSLFNLPFTSSFVPFFYNPGLLFLLLILFSFDRISTVKRRY